MSRRPIISSTWYFFQQTLLEVLRESASCFGEQYRDLLLLYLHQMLDENNSSQQVQTAVQQYIIVHDSM